METAIISQIIEKGTTFAILVGTLYYFLVIYIPRKDEAYEKRTDSLISAFRESMKELIDRMDSRLEDIENKLWK